MKKERIVRYQIFGSIIVETETDTEAVDEVYNMPVDMLLEHVRDAVCSEGFEVVEVLEEDDL